MSEEPVKTDDTIAPPEDAQPAGSQPAEAQPLSEAPPSAAPVDATEADAPEIGDEPLVDDEGDEAPQAEVDPVAAAEAARAAAELEAAEAALDLSEPEVAPAGPIEEAVEDDEEIKLDWYILKVQSNRERSIAAALQRKVAIEGLDRLFGEIMVPTEKVTEFKGGKKKIVERKLWPGYIAVQMHVNDDTWFAIRETGGIGDFTGSGGAPTPMSPQDVAKILHKEEEETSDEPKLNIPYKPGDKIKVNDGNFESFEGEVSEIDDQSGKVTIMISIFGRSTPVELDYWQVEAL